MEINTKQIKANTREKEKKMKINKLANAISFLSSITEIKGK